MPRLPRLILSLGLAALVSACQLGTGSGPGDVTPNAVLGDPIEVTTLDAPPPPAAAIAPVSAEGTLPADSAAARGAAPTPEAAPDAAPEAAPEAAADPAAAPEGTEGEPAALPTPKSDAQLLCERRDGLWSPVGNGDLRICIFSTRDGGDRCTRGTDCEGECLARSGTCSPIRPLVGCNEVLQDDGARVTLCID